MAMRERISNQQNCLLLLLLCWWPPNCLIIDTRSMNYLIQNSIIDSSWSYDGNYNQSGIGWERNSESESSAYVFKMNECVQPWVISEAVRLVSNRSWGVGRIESRCERVKLFALLFISSSWKESNVSSWVRKNWTRQQHTDTKSN